MSDPAAPEAVSSAPTITPPRRLHPLTPFARGWQVVAVLFVLMANNMLGAGRWEFLLIGLAIVIPIGSIYGYLSWRFTRWWIEEGVLRLETGVPVSIADDPLTCVARGTGIVLEQIDEPYMERALVAETYSRPPR